MSKCGQVVCEHTYVYLYLYIYIYAYIHIYIYSTPNDPGPLHKIPENTVFLSFTPTFVYLLEKGQHAS